MPVPNQPPVIGAPTELEAEGSILPVLQNAATADGNGAIAVTDGFKGLMLLELQKTGAGTSTVIVEGSFDQATWYTAGYQQIDAIAAPARAVAAFSLAAGAQSHVLQILDMYPFIRARLAATAGAISVLARLYALPL